MYKAFCLWLGMTQVAFLGKTNAQMACEESTAYRCDRTAADAAKWGRTGISGFM